MPDQHITIQTRHGAVIGRRSGSLNVFKGIPYAKPPVGSLRFRPPQSPDPWTVPFDAGAFGPSPLQELEPFLGSLGPMDEDCLTLNVWAPAAPGPHPVLFWTYGGANIVGSSSQAIYDGSKFADQGLVFVSANYRLGAFGFLELGPVSAELAGSGVNGLRDLIAALQWVRDTIAEFGGDPGSVTLMGESAGGKNVCALATSPAARGLFTRIAVQSGGGHTVFDSPDDAAPVTKALLGAAGLKLDEISRLALMPATDLIAAQTKVMKTWPAGFPFRPTVDGEILPLRPVDAAAAGASANVDMIIGTCRDEAALFLPAAQAVQPFQSRQLANVGLDVMQRVEQLYAQTFPDMPIAERRIHQLTAEEYWIPSLRFAEAHVAAGGKAWMYRFDHLAPIGPAKGYAHHGADVPFVFNIAWALTDILVSPADERLAQKYTDFWGRWASHGATAIAGTPFWPAFDLQHRSTMTIDDEFAIVDDPNGDERGIWLGIM